MRTWPFVFSVALGAVSLFRMAAQASSHQDLEAAFAADVQPFLRAYCLGCHGEGKARGGLDLRAADSLTAVVHDFATWQAVLEQVEEGDMPPADAPRQPTDQTRAAVVAWIKAVRAQEAKRNAGDPGVVLARRLSHAEYDNTIRDLTGVDIAPARTFPVDPSNSAGFDNSGESLTMSPALVKKYLAAAQKVADHLVLTPDGLLFAPHPVVVDTDRDRFYVNRIVDFYRRQPTDLEAYFRAAWRHRHRAALGIGSASVSDIARQQGVSPRYLETLVGVLQGPRETRGPIAALQRLFVSLPRPVRRKEPTPLGAALARMRDVVVKLRERVKVAVPNLRVKDMNPGAQALVLWKDRQMAQNRRRYGGGGFDPAIADIARGTVAAAALRAPNTAPARARVEASWRAFARVIPDAFYVSERARVFLEGAAADEDKDNVGRLLSAGFHNQMGYFRDDGPLYELILDDEGRRLIDRLWREFDFFTAAPLRQHASLIWFERSESRFLRDPAFDFARAEDRNNVTEPLFSRFAQRYLDKVRASTDDEIIRHAVREHFERSQAAIRWVQEERVRAQPVHRRALLALAARAYRRPLQADEEREIEAFYERRRQEGAGHEEALRDTLVSVLMSPHFLYRIDLRSGEPGVRPLPAYGLASRLSFFLWGSLPDARLLERAASGRLGEPEVLVAETHRMLADARVRGLVTGFGGAWLDFRRFDEHNAVDRTRFPGFTDELRTAMQEEPIRFFADVIAQDRSVLDFLFANHTFVNPVLARHYGMPLQDGDPEAWTRIENADAFGRGGILPMAVFMTRSSPGLRTSPVKRGYWVVRNLLGERIPPPPATVPELPADEASLGALTLREALAAHRQDPACAGCHDRFDAYGLVFEAYGPVGEARTFDLGGRPVDTAASFPDGRSGTGVGGLRKHLRESRQDDFLDNLCRKLLAYALNRTLLLSDEETIAAMKKRLADDGHRFGALVEAIVTSPQFTRRRDADAVAWR